MTQTAYRADIDGLRAVAVLLVVVFHAFPHDFRAGFIGVDIFFVISGFLITRIIAGGLKAGRFSYADFYARRIRRIFPALAAVLVASMIAGWFVMLPSELRTLGKNVAAGASFVPNFASWLDAGYFGPQAGVTPLLHLWSLGIEEQFYLIWPLLLAFAWRYRNGPLIAVAVIGIASFICNVIVVRTDTISAFYLPSSRFWELMLGCGLALGWDRIEPGRFGLTERSANALRECAAWLGVVLIAVALALIEHSSPFPGWWALLPTLGTALLIASSGAWVNRRVLSLRGLVYIGLISYPLYLWHWPILVFERLARFKEPTALMKVAGVAVAFVLADLTYRLIERRVRFGPSPRRQTIVASVALVLAGLAGLAVFARSGVSASASPEMQLLSKELSSIRPITKRALRCFVVDNDNATSFPPECDGENAAGKERVLIWGDSYAAFLFDGIETLERSYGDFALGMYTAPACPPIFSFVSPVRSNCQPLAQFVAERIEALKPDTVIMSANWDIYSGKRDTGRLTEDDIRATIVRLQQMGVKRVVLAGEYPKWLAPVPKIRFHILRMSGEAAPARNAAYLDTAAMQSATMVRRAAARTSAVYVAPVDTFCNKDGCMLALPSGDSTALDNGHLSVPGSNFFAQENARALLGR